MTITVVTPEHGERSFDADGWETLNGSLGDEGNLLVTNGDDEEDSVAEFAKGAWLFVYETKGGPRVWQDIRDIPIGVKFTDVDGDFWEQEGHRVGPHADAYLNGFAPFTEVLDA